MRRKVTTLILVSLSLPFLAACQGSGGGAAAAASSSPTTGFTGYANLNSTGQVMSSGQNFSSVISTTQAKTAASGTYFQGTVSIGLPTTQFK